MPATVVRHIHRNSLTGAAREYHRSRPDHPAHRGRSGTPRDTLRARIVHFHPPFHGYKRHRTETGICRSVVPIAKNSGDLYRAAASGFETIGSTGDLEAVAEGSGWQNFERLAAFIFERNGFTVSVGTVKTLNRQRRQYDVIAQKNGRTLLVECKQWSGGRYRLSALKQAVGQHRERALFYAGVTGADAVPVMVTLIEEEIRIFNGVPLVPVHRLNAFIGELDSWADGFSFAEFDDADSCVAEDLGEEPDGE